MDLALIFGVAFAFASAAGSTLRIEGVGDKLLVVLGVPGGGVGGTCVGVSTAAVPVVLAGPVV